MDGDREKAIKDLKAVVEVLEINAEAFLNNKRAAYRAVAAQLRGLLCEMTSPLRRLFSDVTFHPLIKSAALSLDVKPTFVVRGEIRFDGKGNAKLMSLFDEGAERIPLDEWLKQPLFNERITIWQLIKSVADKEGVHFDKEYDPTLETTNDIRILLTPIHEDYIVSIGSYVGSVLKSHLIHFKLL